MNLTLLVENNPKIESFFKLNLSTWLGLEIATQSKGESALKFLDVNSSQINLIIVRARIGKEATAKLLIDYMATKNLNIPIIIVGESSGSLHPQVPNSMDIKLLIKTAANCLGITAKEMMSKVVPDFFPIPIEHFNDIKRPVCHVYVQDQKQPKKYTLCFEKMKDFDMSAINAHVVKGVTHLFVDKLDRLDFVSNITSELVATLKIDDLNEDEQLSATDQSVELLSKKLLNLGITEETISLAKKNIDAIRTNVKKNPKLSKLLDRLLSNKSSYLFKHTQILTYVSLHIIRNIDWGTPEQEDKISFISFFHDIALENDIQCEIKTSNELKRAQLSTEQNSLVERHAQIAAELVSKFPHAPMGSDQIIRQHHGQLNGVGFSDHYGANVSPMAIVFIVAEEFTRIIMKHSSGNMNQDDMLRELKGEFPTSRFSKIIEKLQTLNL